MTYKNMVIPEGVCAMDRTLFTPVMLEAFRACKRAYFLAYHRDGAAQAKEQASSVCKRFILRALSEINRAKLTSVTQIQKFMGQYWPVDRLSASADLNDAGTRAFLYTYKTLLRYQSRPYHPSGSNVEAVSLRVRSRIAGERVYLEEVFDLVLYYPAEKKLELVIFSLKEPRPSNPAWPTPTELVRQFLAERLQMRYPFEKLLLTTIKVSPQETKVSRKEASKELFALHWPEVVKSLAEMKELSEMPSHEEDGCRYCEAIESRMVRELNSDEETADAVQKEAAGETIPLSA